MAILLDAGGETFSRTTNLPSITSFTIMAWLFPITDTGAFTAALTFGNEAAPSFKFMAGWIRTGASNTFDLYNGASDFNGSEFPTLNTWYHVAMTVAGTGAGQFLGYVNGVLDVTANGNAVPLAEEIVLGDWDTTVQERFDGRIAAVKIFSTVLTQVEIASEMQQYVPIRWTNLNAWYPMFDTATDQDDFSANGNTLTVGGTVSTAEGPPIPWQRYANRKASFTFPAATSRGWYINSKGGWW